MEKINQIVRIYDLNYWDLLNHVEINNLVMNGITKEIYNLIDEFVELDIYRGRIENSELEEYIGTQYKLKGINRKLISKIELLIKISKSLQDNYGWRNDKNQLEGYESARERIVLSLSAIQENINNAEMRLENSKKRFYVIRGWFYFIFHR